MTVYRNNFDGGTNGSGGTGRITPANSTNSGSGFSHVVDTSTQRWNYVENPVGPGLVAHRTNDTTSGHIRGLDPSATGRGGFGRSIYMASSPLANAVIMQARTEAESHIGSLIVQPNRRFGVNQGSGVGFINESQSGVMSLDELLWVEFFQTPANPASGGKAEYYIFDDTGTDLFSWSGVTTTNVDPPAQYRFGGFSSNEWSEDWFDEVVWGALAEGTFGREPNDDAGPDQTVEPWSIVTLEGVGNGPWSQVSGTPVTLAGSGDTRTFVAPPAWGNEDLVFAYGSDTCTVTVLTATDFFIGESGPVPFRNAVVH